LALDLGIFLAALGITMLEEVEAAAVGVALYAEYKRPAVFLSIGLGTIVVFAPMFALGAAIALLPDAIVKLTGGVLLLYFGQRLVKSARRSVLSARRGAAHASQFEKGAMATAFSVGAIEAFEAAIVLVALLPNSFQSTVLGMGAGIGIVVVASFALRNQVRRVKQARVKEVVAALLLSFSTFWFGEAVTAVSDLVLILLFAAYFAIVYAFANRASPEAGVERPPHDDEDKAREINNPQSPRLAF